MSQTVTCICGKRLTVGAAARNSVVCPQCGEAVSLNEAARQQATLKFAVRKVADDQVVPADAPSKSIQFRCPGCDKQFVESSRAAGKQTTCPQCDTGFVIPAEDDPPAQPVPEPSRFVKPNAAQPAPANKTHDPVAAAVAAYTDGKSPQSEETVTPGRETGRFINPRTIVPIGLLLITLGGLAAIGGAVMTSMGMKRSFSAGGLGGMSELAKVYPQLVQRLAQENGGQPVQPQIDPGQLERQLSEPSEPQSSGQGMMIGGVVIGGIGSLLTFVGGIFLLAGLIGRFIEKSTA